MKTTLQERLEEAIWAAHSLYDRSKTAGSSANISFLADGIVYISASGTCFGRLRPEDFAQVSLLDGKPLNGLKPSKEFALHQALYQKGDGIQAVIHTHSPYATLWSCLPGHAPDDVIPAYTPYLRMKLGRVALVPYAKPGSEELFSLFRGNLSGDVDGYLLKSHGPIVGAKSMMDAYYALEELEESARLAWMLRHEPDREAMLLP